MDCCVQPCFRNRLTRCCRDSVTQRRTTTGNRRRTAIHAIKQVMDIDLVVNGFVNEGNADSSLPEIRGTCPTSQEILSKTLV